MFPLFYIVIIQTQRFRVYVHTNEREDKYYCFYLGYEGLHMIAFRTYPESDPQEHWTLQPGDTKPCFEGAGDLASRL